MGWFKDLKKTLGFSKPDPLPSPQVDQAKKSLNDQFAGYLGDEFRAAKYTSNQGYVSPTKAQEIQSQRAATPVVQSEASRNISSYRPGAARQTPQTGSEEMVFVPPAGPGQMGTWQKPTPTVSMQTAPQQTEQAEVARTIPVSNEASQKIDSTQSAALQAEATKRALANAPLAIAGYDPSVKQAALQEINQIADTETQKALKIAREAMGSQGILNSTVAGTKAGNIAADIASRKISAINDLNAKDAEAQREDRYRNASLASDQISQLSNLAQSGQGMNLAAASYDRQGRLQDIASQTAAAEFARTGNQIDSAEALKRAEFARQGGQLDAAEAWKRYAAEKDANDATATEKRRVQTQNLNAEDLGNARMEDRYNNLLKMIQSYGSGDPYTPESQAAALAAAQQQQEQQNRLSNTLGVITKFIK